MAPKKTLSNWLTNRYLLIIRDEENFAEKKTLSFNYARVILLFSVIFAFVLGLAVYLVTFVLEEWLDPRYAMLQSNRELIGLTMRLDSMEYEMDIKDRYLHNIRRIIGGDVLVDELATDSAAQASQGITEIQEEIHPIDSQLRAEFEGQDIGLLTYQSGDQDEFRELFLFAPLEGLVTDQFNPKRDHFGVDIVAKENEPVKCASDGVVIFSSWTLDGGYVIGVQHRGNLVSVYKHNSEILKSVGSFVSGGEIIAIIGNTGELTSGPHLHFELWHNGNSVNPQEYVAF